MVAALGRWLMASSNQIDGHANGAVTLMNGDHDRVLFAPFALTDFSATRSVLDSVAFGVAVGDFTQPGSGDLIALAFNQPTPKSKEVSPMNVWLVADARAAGAESTAPARRARPATDAGHVFGPELGLHQRRGQRFRRFGR